MTPEQIESIQSDLTEIKIVLERHTGTLNRNTADLATHIMRTDLLQTLVTDIATMHKVLKILGVGCVSLAGLVLTVLGIIQILVPQLP